ncbi:MAG TPA: insulinase family protein [Gemmatimonadaceae bacterium]|nr:insulinase family protein [Gemmatimonadaceae bacterium]
MYRSLVLPLAAAILVPLTGALPAQEPTLPDTALHAALPIDPALLHGKLDNGMRYFILRNGRPESRAELRLVVDAGSVLEDDDQLGLAHFVEHMAFNGTRNFPKNELVHFLESIGMRFGADLNAYTSFDETVFMLTVPTDTARLLPRGIEILADWAVGLTFDSAEIERERGVVIEEWRSGRGAGRRIRDQQFPVIFHDSRYASRLPIGERGTLEGFAPQELKRFYRDWYRPDLMSVVAVGDFDPREVESLIRKAFEPIPAVGTPRTREQFPVPPHDSTLITVVTDPEATSSSVALYVKRPAREDTSVGSMRRGLVERMMISMLNERFQKLGLSPDAPFASAGAGQGALVRSSEVSLLSAVAKPGRMSESLEALLTEAERARRHGFTGGELERARTNLLRGYERTYQERDKIPSAAHASALVQYALGEDAAPGIAAEYALATQFIPSITLDEVNGVAREFLAATSRVIAASAPRSDSIPVATADELREVFQLVQRREIAAYVDSVSDAPLIAELPAPGRIVETRMVDTVGVQVWTLSNGAKVLIKSTDFQDDQVLFSAYSPGGNSLVPESAYRRVALADYVVSTGGLGALSLLDLRKKLTGKVASVSPSISAYEERLNGSGSPKDLETLFQLIHLHFTAPRTDSVVFEALKQNITATLASRDKNPNAVFSDTISVTMSRNHPRAFPLTPARLDSVDVRASLELYRDRFADASDFTFIFVGTFAPDTLRPLVERYLASLPSINRVEVGRDLGIRPPQGVVEKTVRRGVEQKSRTVLSFTGPATYSAENRVAMSALDAVLDIELRDRLREALGGTYGVSVSASVSRVPWERYDFTISFDSDPARVEELTRAVFDQIDSVRTRGASDDILARVHEIARRDHETRLRQNGFWLGQLGARQRDGEPLESILTIPDRIAAVGSSTIREAAQRYLRSDNYARFTLLPEEDATASPTP